MGNRRAHAAPGGTDFGWVREVSISDRDEVRGPGAQGAAVVFWNGVPTLIAREGAGGASAGRGNFLGFRAEVPGLLWQ